MKRSTVTTRVTARTTAVLAASGLALAAAAPPAFADVHRASGELTRYGTSVPAGATARVQSVETGQGRTIVTLHVQGLTPLTEYGAHAHSHACGVTGSVAGPHFQYVPDPVTPSVDPAYANPENEIWLDLTTDAEGEGHAKAVVDWQAPATRRPASVVLHARHTATAAGVAGTAGARLACLTVAF